MTETIVQFCNDLTHNDYLTLFIISIIPIIELRGAIVIMTGMVGVNKIAGMFCCIAGSTVVIIPLILLIRPLIKQLKKTKTLGRLGHKMESHIKERASTVHNDEKCSKSKKKSKRDVSLDSKKFWGLLAFVSVPLPLTGAWTGSAVGSFLDFPIWKAALAVFLGNIIAAMILTTIAIFLPTNYVDVFLYSFAALAVACAVGLYFAKVKRKEIHKRKSYSKPETNDKLKKFVDEKENKKNLEPKPIPIKDVKIHSKHNDNKKM